MSKESQLAFACANGDSNAVAKLLAAKADINHKDKEGATGLHCASGRGDRDIIKLLIAGKADVTALCNAGTAPLCRAKSFDVFRLLLAAKAAINHTDQDGHSVLHCAAISKSIHFVRQLIALKANVNQTGQVRGKLNSPLNVLGFSCRDTAEGGAIIRELVGAKADINHAGEYGFSSLHRAANNSCVEGVKQLIALKADVHQTSDALCTPLSSLSFYDRVEGSVCILRELVRAKSSINHRGLGGVSVLHNAANNGCIEGVRQLIVLNADVNQVTDALDTPLSMIRFYDGVEEKACIIKELVSAKANINHANSFGQTVLYRASIRKASKAVKYLLTHGALLTGKESLSEKFFIESCKRELAAECTRQWARVVVSPVVPLAQAGLAQNVRQLLAFFHTFPGLQRLIGGMVLRYFNPRVAPRLLLQVVAPAEGACLAGAEVEESDEHGAAPCF